jgi:isopentenyldiphosphate isomerase
VQAPPAGYIPWWCGNTAMGLLAPERARWLTAHLGACSSKPHGIVWDAAAWTREQRGTALQETLGHAHAQGLLTGWRNERFSFWHADCTAPDPRVASLFDAERAGFRFLGLLSHAVHVNGFLPDGRLWIARRALSKATDPGLLDNITAGGLPAGETVHTCLLRELLEEANLQPTPSQLQAAGSIRTKRLEPQGWHDEVLHIFNLTLATDDAPHNTDGEVSAFMCLQPHEVLARIDAGVMTQDAVQSLLQGLCPMHATAPTAKPMRAGKGTVSPR